MDNLDLLCMKCMKGIVTQNYCYYCGSPRDIKQGMDNALPLRTILNGRYMVGSMLGAGGFGITYMGYDLLSNRRVAIKEFMPTGLARRKSGERTVSIAAEQELYLNSMERFLEEARIIYHYRQNPNILQVYSLFKENNTAYYIMEFLEGNDLKQMLINRGGRMSLQEIMTIAIRIIDTLAVLHRDGVVHRDISPDNIFIGPDMRTTLIDFGASRLFMAQKQLTVILKRNYAPIEQYETKGKQGPWTDIYALAATMYHCLTGYLPPEATDRVYEDTLKPFSYYGINVPPNIENAIFKAMSVRARDRYENIMDFKADLLGTGKTLSIVGINGIYLNARIEITDGLVVGRNVQYCQIVYPANAPGISKTHCQFIRRGNLLEIRDLGSTNGTWLNGKKLTPDAFVRLSNNDVISFGANQAWRVEC